MADVVELNHPLVKHHLTRLRDRNTPSDTFRALVRRLTHLLAYEATQDLRLEPVEIETPLTRTVGYRLRDRIGLVPILRAGLGMVDPILEMIPSAEVWHLGFYRDEQTFQPVEYYKKIPGSNPVQTALVLDPMLATGGSAVAALNAMRDWGVPASKLIALIAAPEGLEKVRKEFPETTVYVCAIDERLNENAYIIPGLGDAGDRIFNAKA